MRNEIKKASCCYTICSSAQFSYRHVLEVENGNGHEGERAGGGGHGQRRVSCRLEGGKTGKLAIAFATLFTLMEKTKKKKNNNNI